MHFYALYAFCMNIRTLVIVQSSSQLIFWQIHEVILLIGFDERLQAIEHSVIFLQSLELTKMGELEEAFPDGSSPKLVHPSALRTVC